MLPGKSQGVVRQPCKLMKNGLRLNCVTFTPFGLRTFGGRGGTTIRFISNLTQFT